MSAEETPCSSGVLRGREKGAAEQGRGIARRSEKMQNENCKLQIANLEEREFAEFMGRSLDADGKGASTRCPVAALGTNVSPSPGGRNSFGIQKYTPNDFVLPQILTTESNRCDIRS